MTTQTARPNFIFIMADQFRADALGVDSNSGIETPNLDFLAARGTRFSHAYSSCPSCIPARAMLWTGMSQWHTGVLSMAAEQPNMPSDYLHTLPGELTAAGYQTQLVGKAHFWPERASMGFEATAIDEAGRMEGQSPGDDYRAWFKKHAPEGVTPDDHGVDFNSWVARPWHLAEFLHPTAWTMTRSIEFLKSRDRSRPFFLNISFDRPHSPYVPPQPYWDMYYGRDRGSPVVGDWAAINEITSAGLDPNTNKGTPSPYQIHRARAGYAGEISFVDAQVGRLMTWLRRYDPTARENTIFLFCSDHGDLQGDHHLWRKAQPYEGSARIPLLLSMPGAKQKSVVSEVVGLMDIMPTVLDLAGIKIPKTVEGHSLLNLADDKPHPWRNHLHGEHGHMHYVTDGKRKFTWFPYENREQFFDLELDPHECHNLITDPGWSEEVAVWRERLTADLEKRECGWTKDGRPFYPGKPLISPFAEKRWGAEGN